MTTTCALKMMNVLTVTVDREPLLLKALPVTMRMFVRRMTNKFMSWLLSRKMGQLVPDTQSGFRLYKCDVLKFLNIESDRFTADSEFLLNLAEAGVLIGAAPIKVIYGDEKSKISPVKDTIRFFKMLSKYRKNAMRAHNDIKRKDPL